MMVRVPSCNIDRPIYIWRMEIRLKDTRTPLHICRQGLPSFILISNKPHCWAINKGSLWNKLAWWPLPASSIPLPPLSPTTNHHHTPLLFTLSHISRDIISFYTWDYSLKGQSQQVFYKKCILMFLHKTKLVMPACLHPSFLTIRSTSNDCEVSCFLFSPTSHLSTNLQKNP